MNNPVPLVEVIDENDVDAELDSQIRKLLATCFPHWSDIFEHRRLWHQTRPLVTVVVRDNDVVVGHVALVVRTITTTWNFRYNVASIQGVCVAPDHRRQKIARQMLDTAANEARQRGFQFAILYCHESLVQFYEWLGWKLADDSIVMWNQRDLPIAMRSNCPMYLELTNHPFPEGPIDVHSPTW